MNLDKEQCDINRRCVAGASGRSWNSRSGMQHAGILHLRISLIAGMRIETGKLLHLPHENLQKTARKIGESLDFDSDHFFRVTRHENGSQVCFTHFAAELAPSFPHSTDSTNPYRPKCLPKKSKFKGTPSHTSRQLCVSLEFLRKCYGFENTGRYSGDMHEKTPHSHIGTNSVLPNSEQNPYNSTITCRDQKGLLTHTALGAIWSKYEEFNG